MELFRLGFRSESLHSTRHRLASRPARNREVNRRKHALTKTLSIPPVPLFYPFFIFHYKIMLYHIDLITVRLRFRVKRGAVYPFTQVSSKRAPFGKIHSVMREISIGGDSYIGQNFSSKFFARHCVVSCCDTKHSFQLHKIRNKIIDGNL